MKKEVKIVIGYVLLLLALGAASYFFPHREFTVAGIVNVSLQLLLALLCFLIMKNSADAPQRMIFFFSFLFFGSGLLLLLSLFAGRSFLTESVYGPFFYHLYVNKAGLALFGSLAILSVAVEFLFHRFSAIQKTILTIVAASVLVFSFFSAYVSHPFGLYKERDYVLLSAMKKADTAFQTEHGSRPSDADLASLVRQGDPQGKMFTARGDHEAELASDVARLRSYLEEGGSTTLFWRPLDLALIYVYGVLIAVIVALLTLYYRGNGHLGAYVDKILILFLLLFSTEIFHIGGEILTPNAADLRVIYGIGQYVTIFCMLLMVYAYDLKLRFVLSAAGKYYEFAVRQSPENVTRWRDELDQLILRTFVKKNHGYGKLGIFTESKSNSDQ